MVEVKFHDIGEGISEGEILNYFVTIGDTVKVDQPLVELQTDKMVAEIPSPAAGTVQAIHIEPGNVVTVGTVILEIGSKETVTENATKKQAAKAKPTVEQDMDNRQANPKEPAAIKGPQRIIATPHTRKVARQLGVDIEQVKGTGPRGRVTIADIHNYVNNGNQVDQIEEPPVVEQKEEQHFKSIPFTGIRKQIAKNMSQSVSTIPHVSHFDEVDLTRLLDMRQELKDTGEHISIAAFFLKALAISLRDFRVFNARLNEEKEVIQLQNQYNIGMATDTEKGLLVPVLRDVHLKTIRDINREMKALTKKAQDGKLAAVEMQGGTFTMSNVGPLGGTGATPIINFPQTALIAFHKTKKRPVVMPGDQIAVRSIMTLSFSFDHRVADGAEAVAFTNRFIELMEKPEKLLLALT